MFPRTENYQHFVLARQIFVSALLFTSVASQDCGDYDSTAHGRKSGGLGISYNDVECPDDGAFIGIDYTWSDNTDGKQLHSISFTCNSSDGITQLGPFGTPTKNNVSMRCPENQHISHIRGKAGEYINDIQINCVNSGLPVRNSRQEHRNKLTKSDEATPNDGQSLVLSVQDFDDSCFTTRGRRMVSMAFHIILKYPRICYVYTRYRNVPVALNCKATRIELVDVDSNATFDAYEILGITVGSTCSSTEHDLFLTVQHAELDFDSAKPTLPITDVNMISIFTNGGDSVSYIADNKNKTIEKPPANSGGNEKSHKTKITYKGPGAAVVVGYRRRHMLTNNKTSVLYHYTCEGGSTAPTTGEMTINGNWYGNVLFRDFHYPFGHAKCTISIASCISRMKLDGSVFYPESLRAKINKAVDKCLQNPNS